MGSEVYLSPGIVGGPDAGPRTGGGKLLLEQTSTTRNPCLDFMQPPWWELWTGLGRGREIHPWELPARGTDRDKLGWGWVSTGPRGWEVASKDRGRWKEGFQTFVSLRLCCGYWDGWSPMRLALQSHPNDSSKRILYRSEAVRAQGQKSRLNPLLEYSAVWASIVSQHPFEPGTVRPARTVRPCLTPFLLLCHRMPSRLPQEG